MGVELSVDPPACPISAAGGTSKHTLVNHCDRPLAFKIKSSNNSNYSVNTVMGIIKVGFTADLVITRIKGKPKADKLVVLYGDVAYDCEDPSVPFKSADGKIAGEITVGTIIKR